MAYYNKSPQNNGDGKNAEDRALDTFANMMIEKIESLGSKDGWQKPWFTEGTLSWPKNLSGREYNGMNALLLTMLCEKKGCVASGQWHYQSDERADQCGVL
jgi:antirestriction protein ArdC